MAKGLFAGDAFLRIQSEALFKKIGQIFNGLHFLGVMRDFQQLRTQVTRWAMDRNLSHVTLLVWKGKNSKFKQMKLKRERIGRPNLPDSWRLLQRSQGKQRSSLQSDWSRTCLDATSFVRTFLLLAYVA